MKYKLLASLVVGGAMSAASASAEVVAVSLSTKFTIDTYLNGAFVKDQSSAGSERSYAVFEVNEAGDVVGTPTIIYYFTEKDSNNKVVKGYSTQTLEGLHYNIVKKGQLNQIFGGVSLLGTYSFTGVASSKGSLRSIKLDPLVFQTTSSDPEGTAVQTGGDVQRNTSSGSGIRLTLNSKITTGDAAVTELINRLEKQGYKSL